MCKKCGFEGTIKRTEWTETDAQGNIHTGITLVTSDGEKKIIEFEEWSEEVEKEINNFVDMFFDGQGCDGAQVMFDNDEYYLSCPGGDEK